MMTSNEASLRTLSDALASYSTDQIRGAARVLETLLERELAGLSEEGYREIRELAEDLARLSDAAAPASSNE